MPVARFLRGATGATGATDDTTVDAALLAAVKRALRLDGDEFDSELSRNIQAATERADRQAPDAPTATKRESIIRFVGFVHEGPTATAGHQRGWDLAALRCRGLAKPVDDPPRRADRLMRFPWQRRAETRASYGDAVVTALLAAATGTRTENALTTAALEACAALFAGAFARAKVEPAVAEVTPALLSLIARDLIRRGASLHLLDVEDGMLKIRPAGSWDIRGTDDPMTWRVRLDLFGPSTSTSRYVGYDGVLHFRYAIDAARPWLGVGPLQWAGSTAALAGRLEAGLADEAGAPAAQIVPIPSDGGSGGDDDPLKQLKADIAAAKGRALLVETTQAGFGQGPAGAPRRDWQQSRVGFEPPDVAATMRDDVFQHVAAACNVPGVLLDPRAEGTSQREALRRFAHLGIEPMGEIVAAELAAKLDVPGLRLNFGQLFASDLAGRARAVGALVKSGVELADARRLAGLDG